MKADPRDVSDATKLATYGTIARHIRTRYIASLVVNKVMAGGIAHRETNRGWLLGAAVVPATSNPSTSHYGYSEEQLQGKVGNVNVEVMLDTGSAVSLLRHKEVGSLFIELVTASGELLLILNHVEVTVQMTNTLKAPHQFHVVHSLIYWNRLSLQTNFL